MRNVHQLTLFLIKSHEVATGPVMNVVSHRCNRSIKQYVICIKYKTRALREVEIHQVVDVY